MEINGRNLDRWGLLWLIQRCSAVSGWLAFLITVVLKNLDQVTFFFNQTRGITTMGSQLRWWNCIGWLMKQTKVQYTALYSKKRGRFKYYYLSTSIYLKWKALAAYYKPFKCLLLRFSSRKHHVLIHTFDLAKFKAKWFSRFLPTSLDFLNI